MAFVDLNMLPAFGAMIQWTSRSFRNLTTTQICQGNITTLTAALRSHPHVYRVYNKTFGKTEPSELPDLFDWAVPHDDVRFKEIILFSCLTAAALLAVVFRVWTSVVYLRRISAADWSISIGMVLTIGYVIVLALALEQADNGKHVWDVRMDQFVLNVKMTYILQIYILIAFVPVKMAFLFFYQTMSDQRAWRIIIGIVGLLVAAVCIAFTILTGLVYTPDDWFDQLLKHRSHEVSPLQGSGIASLILDIIIYFLPIPMLAKFDFGRVEKAFLFFLFIIGGLAIIASAMRMVSMMEYARGHDFTWTSNIHLVWTVVQLNVAIICVSLPGIRPMLVSKFQKWFVAEPEVEDSDKDDDDEEVMVVRKSEDRRGRPSLAISRKDSFPQPLPTTGVVSRVESRGGSDVRGNAGNNSSNGIMVTYTYDVGSMIDINTLVEQAEANAHSRTQANGFGYAASANPSSSNARRSSVRASEADLPAYEGPGVRSNEKGFPPGTLGIAA